MTYEVYKWRLQFDHLTLSQNCFWSVHYILDMWFKCWCHLYHLLLSYVEKIRISGDVCTPSPINNICKQSSVYKRLGHDSNFQNHGKEAKKVKLNSFLALFSKTNLTRWVPITCIHVLRSFTEARPCVYTFGEKGV